MLDEVDAIEIVENSVEPRPRERLRRIASRLPGVRFLSPAPGGSQALALEIGNSEDEFADEVSPDWIAVADGADQLDALRAGAVGVVSGTAGVRELSAAVEAVRQGYAVLPLELLHELTPAEGPHDASRIGPPLTPREVSVLQLLSEGATNKMIARRLDISVHTAKFHVASILDKLDATTRTDAVAQGVRQGVLML